jgi:hypothetical protein
MDLFIQKEQKKPNYTCLLSDKYTPVRLGDWMDNKVSMAAILSWISSDSKLLVVDGQSGSGKSSVINLICKETGLEPFYILPDQLHTTKSLTERYRDIKTYRGVFIIDDFQLFFNNIDINPNNFITELMCSGDVMRCILVIDSSYITKLKMLLKQVTRITFYRPSLESIFNKCILIMQSEDIYFDHSNDANYLKTYIKRNDNNVRYIINSLHLYKCTAHLSTFEGMNLYDLYGLCTNKDISLNLRIKYFEVDSGTIPVICQENYIDHALEQSEMSKISEFMSLGDIFHKQAFSNPTNVNMGTYACLSSIVVGQYISDKSRSTQSPRFGLIWTKQASKYQKLKYIDSYNTAMKCVPKDNYSNFIDHLYLRESLTTPKIWNELNDHFQTGDPNILYNIYNAFLNDASVTKKSFVSKINKLKYG